MLSPVKTRGSTRRSRRSDLSLVRKYEERVPIKQNDPTKSAEENPIKIPQVTTELKFNEVESVLDNIIADTEPIIADTEPEKQEELEEIIEPESEVKMIEEEFPKRPESSSTWKTSGSQREYIDKLEQMLKIERIKRVELEAKLEEKE